MIYGIEGDCGSGKTLLCTILMYRDFLAGKVVYANYGLRFGKREGNTTKILTEEFFRNYEAFPIFEATLGMDELSVYYSARESHTKQNKRLRPFILQTRKRTLKLFYTAQQLRLVDVNIRENTDGIYYPEMWVSRHGSNYIRMPETWRHQAGDVYVLKYRFFNKKGLLAKCGQILHAERFFKLYDTNEIIHFNSDEKKVKG